MVGFNVVSEDVSSDSHDDRSSARLGLATLSGQRTVQTPCLMLHTGKGCSQNVTWDGLDGLCETLSPGEHLQCQLDVLQVAHQHGNMKKYIADASKSGHVTGRKNAKEFLGFPSSAIVVALPRNPTSYEHIGMTRNSTDERASFMTFQGAAWTTPEDYMDIATCAGADIIVALGDEVVSDARKNRVVESSKRTIGWMKRAMDWIQNEGKSDALIVCPIVGGGAVSTRKDAIAFMPFIEDGRVHGVYISGLGTGESAEDRREIINLVVSKVPQNKIRIISGVSNPVEILETVDSGVDMFDTAFVDMATRAGLALCFPTDGRETIEKLKNLNAGVESNAMYGLDGTKMNLWSDAYRTDKSPIVRDCRCATCRQHTKGYVHHLLITHEMTAHVLIEQHNIYHMLRFFSTVRREIGLGAFKAYRDAFIGYVQSWQRS
jgi:queuine tRNA-ribosyltransferase subunit QTRTD1